MRLILTSVLIGMLSAGFSVACGGEARSVRVIDHVDPDGSFTTRDVTFTTMTDMRSVSGDYVTTLVNAELDLAQIVGEDDAVSRELAFSNAEPAAASWVLDGDVAVPDDYHSLNMFSAFAHFEDAVLYFQERGVAQARESVPVYYHPSISEAGVFPRSDNATFFANVDGFLLLPMSTLQDIPFPMNPGVLAHEYAHRVFYFEAWAGQMLTILAGASVSQLGEWNVLRGTDEGVADYFGAVIADDPRFLSYSVWPDIGATRDLSVVREIDVDWVNGVQPTFNGAYDPYGVGAVVASTLWAFGEISGREAVAVAILGAQRQLADRLVVSFGYNLGELEVDVISALPPADLTSLCDRAQQSYVPVWNRFATICP